MSIPEAREVLGASRKYLLPFLEGLDREGLTVRQGDYRVLGRRAAGAARPPGVGSQAEHDP